MDYTLDIYAVKDEDHLIEFEYKELIKKPSLGRSFLSTGTPAKEWVTRTNTFTPSKYVITMTPYKDVIRKAQNFNLGRKDPMPLFVEYDEVKLKKQAAVIVEREEYPIIKWEEYTDEHMRGSYPTMDEAAIKGMIERVINEFKRTNEYNIIVPNAGCDYVWQDPEEMKKALA